MVKRLTKKQKEILRQLVNFKCQNCKKSEKEVGELHVHRIRRGFQGGEYVPNNIMMLCEKCHREFHSGEFT